MAAWLRRRFRLEAAIVPDPSPRSAWRASVLCGLVVLALSAVFSSVVPRRTCTGDLPPGTNPLLAFQFAREPADVEAVFGPPGPCRDGMVAMLDRADLIDLFLFIPAYAAFLAFWFTAILRSERGTPARAARAGLAALAAGAALDILETATQLRLTRELPGTREALHLLAIGSTGKFAALAVVAACAGLVLLESGRGPTPGRGAGARWAGIACIAGAAIAAIGLAVPAARGLLGLGNAIAWLAMLLHAANAALRRIPA